VKQEATTMALGKHLDEQQEMWVATTSLPKSPGHVFYRKLNELLAEADFDRTVEKLCRPYYHSHIGRPGIPPGVYFRMLLVGYFEGIGSQRGIAWRCADSLSPREFLGTPLTEDTPDHSSLTRVHDRLPLEIHEDAQTNLSEADIDVEIEEAGGDNPCSAAKTGKSRP
jgi:transposase